MNFDKISSFSEAVLANFFGRVDHELVAYAKIVPVLESHEQLSRVKEQVGQLWLEQDTLALVALHDLRQPISELTHDAHRVVLRDAHLGLEIDSNDIEAFIHSGRHALQSRRVHHFDLFVN